MWYKNIWLRASALFSVRVSENVWHKHSHLHLERAVAQVASSNFKIQQNFNSNTLLCVMRRMWKSVIAKMWGLNAEKLYKLKNSYAMRCMRKIKEGKGFPYLFIHIQTLSFVTPINKCLQYRVFQSSGLNLCNFVLWKSCKYFL